MAALDPMPFRHPLHPDAEYFVFYSVFYSVLLLRIANEEEAGEHLQRGKGHRKLSTYLAERRL